MNPPLWDVGIALGVIASGLLTRAILRRLNLRAKNFRGELIPVGGGLFVAIVAVLLLVWLGQTVPWRTREAWPYTAVVGGMAVLGFADDIWGDRSATGLRGHFRKLLSGSVTTGLVKAIGGLVLGIVIARFILQRSWAEAVVDGTIIALSANAINLFDLRPGRAGAVFLLMSLALVSAVWRATGIAPLLIGVMFPALLLYVLDRSGWVMMGDVGSNALGGALGLALVMAVSSPAWRLAILGMLIALHVLAERVSISALIERNAVLRTIDSWTGVR